MALKLSKNVGLNDLVTAINPITTQHVNTGEAKQSLVYLFNDAAAKRYESVVITAIDTNGTNESSWVTFAPDSNGTAGSFSSSLSLANITDSNVPKPFWVRVTSLNLADAQNKTDLSVRVSANEFAV